MKTVNEYIQELQYQFDEFDNYIISECNIELWKKSKILQYGNDLMYESLGIFKGAKDIANYILNQLKNNENGYNLNIRLQDIKNYNGDQFTEIININPKYDDSFLNKEEAGYIASYGSNKQNANDYNIMRWDNVNKKFTFIEINIKCDYKHIDNIYSLLLHELNHAYDDYIHIKNDGFDYSLISRNLKTKYHIFNSKKDDDSIIEQVTKEMIYLLNKCEQDSYIAQLNGELKDKYDNIKDAINDLKQSNIYQNYKVIYLNYNTIIKSNKYTQDFCNAYRKLYDNKQITNEQIIKKINKMYEKFWKKFINHIYHIAEDHIIKEAYITHDSKELVKKFESEVNK